ncbi:dipeptide ABC transporter ATP-binding protein [Paenibacillus terreus]|uniref:Dipeptide ABC transporter ATP-binding protein n=1 Tax=Paenibacillus terreus TaxID=1387834 RepID=A0ABV5B4S3_9BACL
MRPLLEIEHLSVEFPARPEPLQVLYDISLTIAPRENICLVGESGSGKTVTSKAVMRLTDFEHGRITGGRIRLNGMDLTQASPRELRLLRGKKMAMIFQEPMSAFDPVYTIGHQITQTILTHDRKKTRAEARKRAIYLLSRVGIPEPGMRMKQYPGELSGGMLQRAMIAMALSCGPELLIADEPTTALDVTIQAQILGLLQELKQEFNMSILLITHDLGVAAQIADRIIVMYAGRIVEQAAAAELFSRPLHPYSQGLLQSVATLDTEKGTRLPSIEGSIPALTDLPSGCLFHPRCPFATDRCMQEAPPLEHKDGRDVACWHAEQSASTGKSAGQEPPSSREVSVPASVLSPRLMDAPELFQINRLSKYYPIRGGRFGHRSFVRAVDDVSFSIRQGETFGLVGESGSGKSTLGRLLLQLENQTSGEVKFQGRELSKLRAAELRSIRRDFQMIFQDPYGSLDPRWKVGEIIGAPLEVHDRLSGKEKQLRVGELLESVGLAASAMDRYPHEFSGGQRQRIGIARAIALRPRFILADEAVSALDVSVQAQIVNLLLELQEKLGLTYLFIAHGLQIVRHISDRIGVMYLGKLVEIAPAHELFASPTHPYTRALIESIPHMTPGQQFMANGIQGEIPSPARPPSGCRFHTRCPFATAKCRTEQPELVPAGDDRFVACHYPL